MEINIGANGQVIMVGRHELPAACWPSGLEAKLCLNFRDESLEIDDFIFVHDFQKKNENFQITGHIHPGFVINSSVKNIKLPCFVVSENQLLLPAFSEFTGLDTKKLPKKGRFYIFTDAEIYEI